MPTLLKTATFELESSRDSVNRVAGMIAEAFDGLGLPDQVVFDVKLATQEAVINAAEHGNRYDPQKRVHVRLETTDEAITVAVRDEGLGFQAECVPDPTLPENLLKENGRGIFLMRKLCDEVRYNEKGDEVTIVKKIPCPA